MQSENLKRWLLLDDDVLVNQASATMGAKGLAALAAAYVADGMHFQAAKATFSLANLGGTMDWIRQCELLKEVHSLLERSGTLGTTEGQEFEWKVLTRYWWSLDQSNDVEEKSRVSALQEAALKNTALQRDPEGLFLMQSK